MNEKHNIEENLRSFAEERRRLNQKGNDSSEIVVSEFEMQRVIHELEVHQIELEMQNDELIRARLELQNERDRYFGLYDLAPVGYLTLTASGVIKEANLTASNLFGKPRTALCNTGIFQYIHGEDRELFNFNFKQFFSLSVSQNCELRLSKPNNTFFWAHVQTLSNDQEELKLVFMDISNQKMLELELQEAKKLAVAASLAKSQFLSNMSHEIRTPLNGIVGAIQLLRTMSLNTEQREIGDIVYDSSLRLVELLNNILDLSKIEANMVDLEFHDFEIRKELQSVVDLLAFNAKKKGLTLEFVADSSVPDRANGDSGRISQVVTNLIGNAIKFTESGSIKLGVHVLSSDHEAMFLKFSIFDDGIGISPDVLDEIFQPFTQADNSTTRVYGGTGLGLTISRQLVELMGGSMGVESALGFGSTFWFTAKLKNAKEEHELKMHKILLVDDDATARIILPKLLKTIGFVVETASNGKEAIEMLEINDYSLVLMDCSMPYMSGYEAVAIIRNVDSKVRQHDIVVIALTGNTSKEDSDHCKEVGMNDHVGKPLQLPELRKVLDKWLSWQGEATN